MQHFRNPQQINDSGWHLIVIKLSSLSILLTTDARKPTCDATFRLRGLLKCIRVKTQTYMMARTPLTFE